MSAYNFICVASNSTLGGVTDDNLREAVKWFERAIQADPNFGRSYAMKVCAVSGLPGFDCQEGERIMHRALELDPTIPKRTASWVRFRCRKAISTRRENITRKRWS